MSLALSSNFSATAPLLKVPPLQKPNFVRCDEWYSYSEPHVGLRLDDCENAWMQLPTGTNPVTWYINAPGPHNQLPLRVSHGECEIVISASGKSFEEEHELQVVATADAIRYTAWHAMKKCIVDENGLGGYATNQFAKVVNWITASDTPFPQNLDLPDEITFITAMVWKPWSYRNLFEPGSRDEWTAIELNDALLAAVNRAPEGSVLQDTLRARLVYVQGSEAAMDNGGRESGYMWWSGPVPLHSHGAFACDQKLILPGAKNCSSNSTPSDLRIS